MYICECVYVLSMYGASGGQKRELEFLELSDKRSSPPDVGIRD